MPSPVQTAIIRHKRWIVKDSSEIPTKYQTADEHLLGLCVYADRVLHIPKDGTEELDLDVVIHECLHAATELDENAVTKTATDIAHVLWRLGWRKEL